MTLEDILPEETFMLRGEYSAQDTLLNFYDARYRKNLLTEGTIMICANTGELLMVVNDTKRTLKRYIEDFWKFIKRLFSKEHRLINDIKVIRGVETSKTLPLKDSYQFVLIPNKSTHKTKVA